MRISRSQGKFYIAFCLFLSQWNITMSCVVYLRRVSWPHDCLWHEPGECFLHSSDPTPSVASLIFCLNPKSPLWLDSVPWKFCRILQDACKWHVTVSKSNALVFNLESALTPLLELAQPVYSIVSLHNSQLSSDCYWFSRTLN